MTKTKIIANKVMECVDNTDVETVLTVGKKYVVKIKDCGMVIDKDNIINECTVRGDDNIDVETLVDRFSM
jgi:hypothetical protein